MILRDTLKDAGPDRVYGVFGVCALRTGCGQLTCRFNTWLWQPAEVNLTSEFAHFMCALAVCRTVLPFRLCFPASWKQKKKCEPTFSYCFFSHSLDVIGRDPAEWNGSVVPRCLEGVNDVLFEMITLFLHTYSHTMNVRFMAICTDSTAPDICLMGTRCFCLFFPRRWYKNAPVICHIYWNSKIRAAFHNMSIPAAIYGASFQLYSDNSRWKNALSVVKCLAQFILVALGCEIFKMISFCFAKSCWIKKHPC